jgi:hypothetical protein
MEKAGARRLSTAQPRSAVQSKSKVTRSSSVAPKVAPAGKVIKVVPKVVAKMVPKVVSKIVPKAVPKSVPKAMPKAMPKVVLAASKERASIRPPAAGGSVPRAVSAVSAVSRVEPARINGSEHGVAVSRTDHLKARFAALSSATAQIKALKRTVQKNFFEIGSLLARIRDEKLYEVKGYGSFDSFVEREVDLDKVLCLRLARMAKLFVREAALEVGLERASAAMAALDGDNVGTSAVVSYPVSSSVSSALPAHKR